MSDDLVKRLRAAGENGDPWAAWHLALQAAGRIAKLEEQVHYANGVADLTMKHRDYAEQRVEKLEAALREMLEIVATHRVYVGNSPAGELACEWTMDAIKEIHAKMEDVIARKALEGKDD